MEEKDLQQEEQDLSQTRLNNLIEIITANYHAEKLRELLSDYHANDIAQVLPLISPNVRARLYTVLSNEELSDVFSYLENPAEFTEELSDRKLADIITEMASDDAVDLLEELDEEKKNELIDLLDEETAHDVELISAYEEDCLGSLMTNDFVSILNTFTVKQAMNSVVSQAENCENITTIYVTDENGVYHGAILLKDLFIARANSPLEDIVATSYPCFNANLKITDVLERIKEYSEESLPIVDNDNRLIGALTGSDIVEAAEDEMQEDYAKLAGLSESPEEDSTLMKNLAIRLPWLLILLALSMLVSTLISSFDSLIAVLPLLAFFQPMILGMSGNAGTQALGVTVRNIATEQESLKTGKMVAKEVAISFVNGLFLAVISFVVLGLYITFFKDMPPSKAFMVSACIGIALLFSITVSGLCGCVVPLTFRKIGIDPAAASGPLITTVSDLVSALTYYGLISLIINFIAV